MDIRNGEITVGELLQNKEVVWFLRQNYPFILMHPMVKNSHSMTLNEVVKRAGGILPPQRIASLVTQLRRL